MAKKRKSKRKKRQAKKIRFWIGCIECILLCILIPAAVLVFKISQIQTYDTSNFVLEQNEYNDPNISNYTNIALFGVDSRANALTKNTRSDCIMIASINNQTKEIKIASVYRDTRSLLKFLISFNPFLIDTPSLITLSSPPFFL